MKNLWLNKSIHEGVFVENMNIPHIREETRFLTIVSAQCPSCKRYCYEIGISRYNLCMPSFCPHCGTPIVYEEEVNNAK